MDLLLRRIVNLAFDMFPRTHIGQYSEIKRGSVVQIRQGKACIVYVADSGQLTYEQRRIGSFNAMKLDNIGPLYAGLKRVCIKTVGLLMLLLDTLNVSACLCLMK